MRVFVSIEFDRLACEADVITSLVALANLGLKPAPRNPAQWKDTLKRRRDLRLFVGDAGSSDLASYLQRVVREAGKAGAKVERAFATAAGRDEPGATYDPSRA